MTVICDAGPVLRCYWLGCADWALPPGRLVVVETVWGEVKRLEPDALLTASFIRTPDPPTDPALASWRLDDGDRVALSFALSLPSDPEKLVVTDDLRARRACRALALPLTGTLGLIVDAARAGRVSSEEGVDVLRVLRTRGRLHISEQLIDEAIRQLRGS